MLLSPWSKNNSPQAKQEELRIFNCSLLDLQLPLFIFFWGEKEYAGKGSILKILVFSKFPIKIDFGFSQGKEKRKFSLLLW